MLPACVNAETDLLASEGKCSYLGNLDSVMLLFGHDIKSSDMPHKDKGLNQEYTMFCVYI